MKAASRNFALEGTNLHAFYRVYVLVNNKRVFLHDTETDSLKDLFDFINKGEKGVEFTYNHIITKK